MQGRAGHANSTGGTEEILAMIKSLQRACPSMCGKAPLFREVLKKFLAAMPLSTLEENPTTAA
jgi:hypothetical protein